jgi:hypothetical protein|tara:strand:+ start:1056 stop:1415 length:360 start_codon:yes stop_codon:yes gene_type:complete
MNIEEMKAFAALTDEEREKKIKIEEAKKTAKEDFYAETFSDWNGYYKEKTANCGCGDIYWSIDNPEEQAGMTFCFDENGNIGSAWDDYITLGSLFCTNCGGKPKMPKWYEEEYLEACEQ